MTDHRSTLWPTGQHYSYSKTNAGLAEHIIEKVSLQKYEKFLHSRLFGPLGMSSAILGNDSQTMAALAHGYKRDAQTPLPHWHISCCGLGAINLKPIEISPFLRFLLNRGKLGDKRILSKESIKGCLSKNS